MTLKLSEAMKDRENIGQEAYETGQAAVNAEETAKQAEGSTAEAAAEGAEAVDTADAAWEAETEGTAEETSDPTEKNAKKGFFSKKKDKKEEQIEELTDRLKRSMAEFDNYRKRTEKEKAAMYEIGAKDIIEKLLPVVDNFERGLAAIPEGEAKSAFAEGMDKIYKQMMKMLEDAGVKPIEAVGQEFDPNFHNAVMHVDDENLGENIIAEEFQKGYLYRDSVVRHSMVKVAN